MQKRAFTIVELLAAIAIIMVLSVMAFGAGWKVYENSSLAVSASNIRQLAVGGMNYLAEHNYVYWPWCQEGVEEPSDAVWWFGYEAAASRIRPEGSREFDPGKGPLGGYIPKGIRPDPSFSLNGNAFKPKYRNGYIGTGYNTLLAGGWRWVNDQTTPRQNYWQLSDPSKVVVFFTSAQVAFQPPASPKHPMLEEFYGVDAWGQASVHFRHNGKAMVSFANGSAGFIEMDKSTLDSRMPKAKVGRFAPKGDTLYLK